MIPQFQEFPKALYASAAGDGYAEAYHHGQELELRAKGLRMLPEWYASKAADEAQALADREAAERAKAQAEADARAQAEADAAELAALRAEKAEREAAAAAQKKK